MFTKACSDFAKNHALSVGILGNILEWYNYALFMPFLPVISKQFFPQNEYRELFTFLVMSMGLFVRPLGSAVFGPIGDRFGRQKAISLSIFCMVIPTIGIAFLPGYESIGILSPILLVLLRGMQGISMGGEYTAAMVHLVEKAPANRRGFFGSFSDSGSQVGVLLGGQSLMFLYTFFSNEEIYDYAWRIPFFMAIILLPFVFLVPKQENVAKKEKKSIIELLGRHKKEVLCTIAITSFSATAFYTLLTFFPFVLVNKGILSLDKTTYGINIANIVMIISILSMGYLSDKFPRKIFLMGGVIGTCVFMSAMLFCDSIAFESYVALTALCGFFMGTYYSSRSAFFAESFPAEIRCTAVSVSLSLAQAVFGGCTPAVTNYLMGINNNLSVIPIIFCSSLALIALFSLKSATKKI